VLADKSILESKDLLSENRSGSPNIHSLRNPRPHSKWCLACYNNLDPYLQTFMRILNNLVFNARGTCQNLSEEHLRSSSCKLTPKLPQNPKWVVVTLGRLLQFEFLIFFYAIFTIGPINQILFGVEIFIAF
jgi:hypothetical protein